jgi:hypothetical protein
MPTIVLGTCLPGVIIRAASVHRCKGLQEARIPLVVRGVDGGLERAEGGYASTGNRDVDKAILGWAHGVRFNTVQCVAGRYRFASIQIAL